MRCLHASPDGYAAKSASITLFSLVSGASCICAGEQSCRNLEVLSTKAWSPMASPDLVFASLQEGRQLGWCSYVRSLSDRLLARQYR